VPVDLSADTEATGVELQLLKTIGNIALKSIDLVLCIS
jgi:hypothetical protein